MTKPSYAFSTLRFSSRMRAESEVFQIDFVPPLPDLRYGSPQTPFQSDAFMSLNGQSVYSHANVQVEGIDRSTHILIEPTAPYWAAERPISIVHHPQDKGVESHAWVLTHGAPQQHLFKLSNKDTFVPEHLLDTQLMIWNKNPHRVSTLDVDPQIADLKGGTWANGRGFGHGLCDPNHSRSTLKWPSFIRSLRLR